MLVRAWGLTAPGFWQDEALAHFYALQDPAWILEYCAGPINHPPLFFLLLHGWLELGLVYSQAWVESLNLLIGLATLIVFYRWMEFSFGRNWGLVLTTLLAFHPFHVYYSTELRMYALAAFALTVVGHFSTRILRYEGTSNLNWLGWILGCLVAVYSHSFTLPPVLLAVVVLGVNAYRKGLMRRWSWATGVFFVLYLPWSGFVLNQAMRISGSYWLPPFRWSYLWTLLLWMGGYIGPKTAGFYYQALAFGVLIGVVLPLLVGLSRYEDNEVLLVILMVLLPVAGAVLLSLFGQSIFLYRLFFPLLPLFLFLVARGLKSLPFAVAGVCCLVWSVVLVTETVNLKNNPPNQYTRRVGTWIDRLRTPDVLVLHTSGTTYFPSRFYHEDAGDEFFVGARDHLGVTLTETQRSNLGRFRPVLVVYPTRSRPDWLNEVSVSFRHELNLEGYRYVAVELRPEDP